MKMTELKPVFLIAWVSGQKSSKPKARLIIWAR